MLDSSQLFWTRIAAAIVLVLFLGMLVALSRQRRRREVGKSWLKTTGDILLSEVRLPPTHTSDDQPDADAIIRYRYAVGTETFESEAISFGGRTSMMRAHADALAWKYPVGIKVDVHYDPRNPKDAVLEPATQDGLVAQLAITLVLGIIGLVLVVHGITGKVLYTANGVPLFAFALPAVAFIAGGAGVVSFANGRRRAQASAEWPAVTGTITTSTIIEETIENKSNDDDKTIRSTKRYRTDLRYAYRVGERDYVGTNALGDWTPIYGLREQAEKVAAAYPRGRSVVVRYNPAKPGTAVLESGKREGSLAPLAFGAICGAGGALLLVFFVAVGFGQ